MPGPPVHLPRKPFRPDPLQSRSVCHADGARAGIPDAMFRQDDGPDLFGDAWRVSRNGLSRARPPYARCLTDGPCAVRATVMGPRSDGKRSRERHRGMEFEGRGSKSVTSGPSLRQGPDIVYRCGGGESFPWCLAVRADGIENGLCPAPRTVKRPSGRSCMTYRVPLPRVSPWMAGIFRMER